MIQSLFTIFVVILFFNLNFQVSFLVNGEVNFSQKELLEGRNEYFNDTSENKNLKEEFKLKISADNEKREKLKNSSWFLNIPLLPIIVATSNSIPEGPCKKQLRLYLKHLKNGTLWATEMFDSSAKYPYGVFDGLTRHLGSFDQCYRIQTTILDNKKNGKIEEIRSRYCLVDIKYKEKEEPKNTTEYLDIWFDPQGSAWESIREKGDERRYQRYLLQMALCVPATCYPEDIILALKKPLDKFSSQYNLQVQASVQNDLCQAAHETRKFSNYAIIYCFIIFLMIALVTISTKFDINFDKEEEKEEEEEDKSLKKKLLLCFSARRSLKSIFKVNYWHRGFDCLHFLRLVFTSVVLIGHRHIQFLHGSNVTGRFFEHTISFRPTAMILHNGSIIVDGYFGLGGLLMSYQLLEYLEKSRKLNIPLLIIKRYLRITPLYAFVIFGYAVLFHHFGSGPFWENRFGLDRDSCSSNWWANLLFINNYYNGKETCVFQSWYLAVDFQCYIVGLFIIGAFRKMSRKCGYFFLGCIFIISTFIPFYITYKYNVDPLFKAFGNRRRMEDFDYFTTYYMKTHMRFPAYIVGIIVGGLIYDYKFVTWRLSKFWSRILVIFQIVILSLYIEYLGIYFVDPNEKSGLFFQALYASFHRPIFAFSMCSVALLMTIGDGLEFHYNFMTSKWVQPISRLSYGIFLLHFFIQSYELGTSRTPFEFSFYYLVKYWATDLMNVSILSLFFVIIIEEPFKNLCNILLMKKEPTKLIRSFEATKKVN